jgi:hypothetical protein
MEPQEKELLRSAILCISDPRGNWDYGWRLICQFAEMNPSDFPAPFRNRTATDMAGLSAIERQFGSPRNGAESDLPSRSAETER